MLKNSLAVVVLTLLSTAAQAAVHTYRAELSGANEFDPASGTLGVGDPDGHGVATITIDSDTDLLTWSVDFHNLGEVTASHIHTGVAGSNGPVLIPFNLPSGLSGNGNFSGTIGWFPNAWDVISSAPSDFYVNVHTSEFPAGAIRGQLVAVPEPETWALLGLGLGGVMLARRRSGNKQAV